MARAECMGGCCLFVWGGKLNNETIKREEIMNWPWVAAISSSDTTINQLLESAMEGMMERTRGPSGAYGGMMSLHSRWQTEGQKNTKIKYDVALDGRCSIFYMQQPTKNMQV